MPKAKPKNALPLADSAQLEKSPTGIRGLDEIANGGLPKGRTSLVCGNAGCGKTILAMEFVARGAVQFGEPGVFMAFEETPDELEKNFLSLGFDLKKLVAKKLLAVDYVYIERSEIEETGSYDLDGLFIRLGHAIDSVGAKRVVLDTLEVLFAGLSDQAILRAELRRLFRWLKERGVTAIVTGERGQGMLTRYGLEEYVADCVILLDLRVQEQIATRRLRLVKYRGSKHGADEYPFLIDENGLSILPISSLSLNHHASTKRVSSGISRLDRMLDGKGYFRGSTVLVSGTAGAGKSSLAAAFALAACERGERCLYFAFEESPAQIVRNMKSIGLDLEPMVKKGLLRFHAIRPSLHGLEMHLVTKHKAVDEFKPSVVVLDPISSLVAVGTPTEAKSMLTRLIDFLKSEGITAVFADLVTGRGTVEQADNEISSLIDTWILLRDLESNGELNRGLQIIKSRGMSHSNQIREFLLTNKGIDLLDVYLGPAGVLTGSARIAQAAEGKAEFLVQQQQQVRKQHEWRRRRSTLERQMAELRAQSEMEEEEERQIRAQEEALTKTLAGNRADLAQLRGTDQLVSRNPGKNNNEKSSD